MTFGDPFLDSGVDGFVNFLPGRLGSTFLELLATCQIQRVIGTGSVRFHEEKMALQGTDPESCITEFTSVYEDKTDLPFSQHNGSIVVARGSSFKTPPKFHAQCLGFEV